MSILEQLIKIPELNIAKRVNDLIGRQLEKYVAELNTFVDEFPTGEARLRTSLAEKDTASISKHVFDLREMLVKIGAEELASECWKHLNNFNNVNFDRINAYVVFFLSSLATLSIDIQMAIYKDKKPPADADTAEPASPSSAATEKAKPVPNVPSAQEAPLPVVSDGIKRVMAVDDDPSCLEMLKFALKEATCKVIGATSAESALYILRTQEPDLYILDIEMPVMDGITLAKTIKRLGHNAPILFITGKANKEYVVKAASAGASDFILKPINPENVVRRINKFL